MKPVKPTLSALMLALCSVAFAANAQTGSDPKTDPPVSPMTSTQPDSKGTTPPAASQSSPGTSAAPGTQRSGSAAEAASGTTAGSPGSMSSAGSTASGASGATMDLGPAPQSKDQIKDQYDMDKKTCDGMDGNAKDVCEAEAKAKRDFAEADREAYEKKRDAQYDVAKARCDGMDGDAKDACMKDAKTQHEAGKSR